LGGNEMYIGIVAGESSGDQLGLEVIQALRQRWPDARFVGVGGALMRAAGVQCLYDMSEISFVGLEGLARHVFRILSIRKSLIRRFLKDPPDLFIGIDVPDFNLSLEKALKVAGIKIIHYVAPTVWAWRSYRINKIRQAVDVLMVLFPFELEYFTARGVPAIFVGHPIARALAPPLDGARWSNLGIDRGKEIVALLPGSRPSEIKRLGPLLVKVAQRLSVQRPGIQFVIPFVNEPMKILFHAEVKDGLKGLHWVASVGGAMEMMALADVVVVASGTAALEAAILARPMVVTYKVSWLTFLFIKCVSRLRHVSMPNYLMDEPQVAEFLQYRATPKAITEEVISLLDNEVKRSSLETSLRGIRAMLCKDTPQAVGDIVADLTAGANG
jgi:lipid-A-disaccharide synthase